MSQTIMSTMTLQLLLPSIFSKKEKKVYKLLKQALELQKKKTSQNNGSKGYIVLEPHVLTLAIQKEYALIEKLKSICLRTL
jgi:hypothetical protein